jgi:hypothetical protein
MGNCHVWGDEDHNVLQYLTQEDFLKLVRVGTDIVSLADDLQVHLCVSAVFVEDTNTERSSADTSLEAIETNPRLVSKAHRVLYLLFSLRCENPMCMVKETVLNRDTQERDSELIAGLP